jgi:hypothetical protein
LKELECRSLERSKSLEAKRELQAKTIEQCKQRKLAEEYRNIHGSVKNLKLKV